MKLKERKWTKKQVEHYCKRILGYTPTIKMVSMKKNGGYSAMANIYDQRISLSYRVFYKELLWHECGHLMGLNAGSRHWHWTSERDAQRKAILRALNMGYIQIAINLINLMGDWKRRRGRYSIDYPKAAMAIDKEFIKR